MLPTNLYSRLEKQSNSKKKHFCRGLWNSLILCLNKESFWWVIVKLQMEKHLLNILDIRGLLPFFFFC